MNEDQASEIMLAALEEHIQEALAREGLPPLHREQFEQRIREIQAARARMKSLDTAPAG